jgi:hypothetical protein
MGRGAHDGWQQRLLWSCFLAAVAIILSGLFVMLLGLGHPSKAADAVSYVVAVPLLPGMGIVSVFWGSWQAFHQARILLLVPLFSFIADALLLLGIWEFIHGVRSRDLASDNTLHINR